ncbi:hypothetical protein COCVIDRAFT_20178 [Bipolaris victoriae FI3]|uniref:Uncharacterized protein n=1 Tax=Bipolaris victoriae (strain FI3) TaxID=930091 RepID=W7ED30_BIPV3|nr:hypothetical protein COCVIDRAFT_20178 [Bipolaris victoriae FI3]
MAHRSPTHTLRTCTSFLTTATSPSWPGPTHRTTIKLLSLAVLLAATQLGLCAAFAHKLLSMRLEVECWDVDDDVVAGGGVQRGGIGGGGSSVDALVVRTRRLPVTFVNLDRLEGREEGVGGGMWLSLGVPGGGGGKFAIVAALIVNPIFLAVLLACYLRLHLVCAHVTNRCAMGLSVLLGVHFMVNVVGMYLLDVFPGAEVNREYKTCWKDDGVMRALGDWGWWARSVVVCGAVVGVMGACTMIGYFFMGLFAARMNRFDRERPIGLQNLAPSRGPIASGNAADGHNSVSNGPSAPLPAAFSISSRLPRQHSAAERKEESANPFTDPRNVVM